MQWFKKKEQAQKKEIFGKTDWVPGKEIQIGSIHAYELGYESHVTGKAICSGAVHRMFGGRYVEVAPHVFDGKFRILIHEDDVREMI